MSNNYSHHLSVIENFLETTINSEDEVVQIFTKLTPEKIKELEEVIFEFNQTWAPPRAFSTDTMHVGRLFDTLNNPYSWMPRFQTPFSTIETEKLTRLLIYAPSITVWMPPNVHRENKFLKDVDGTRSYACVLACKLVALRPFLEDGSLTFIPDEFYSDVCGWKKPESELSQLKKAIDKAKTFPLNLRQAVGSSNTMDDALTELAKQFGERIDWADDLKYEEHPPSEMLRLARAEAKNLEFRKVLDTIPFLEEAEDHCSDSRYIWGLHEAEFIKYVNPLNEANEDQVVQAILGSSSLCRDETMFKLLQLKHENEALNTNEMIWASTALTLPGIDKISIEDLISVRQNEDAFALWRSTLQKAIRSVSNLSDNQNFQKEAELIFRDEVIPVTCMLDQKIKAKSVKSALKNGAVSFGSTTIAAYALNPSPLASISTGGVTSTLKIIYDLFERRTLKTDRALHRMLTVFKGA